jgi:REP element-mobilizing transposase RayT
MARLARCEIFDPREVAVVHVMNRVCRRCFLLGQDPVSGKSFDHRKGWIENELKRLAAIMGIDLLAFACLSNHFHLILRSRPDVVKIWSDEEVARRWCRLCPAKKCANPANYEPPPAEIAMIVNCPERLNEVRLRLSDISWWMRILCQKIAIRANMEDGEVGKFWQSRYRAVRLLDEESLLACAAYVDLNPIRAAIAETLETSDFTSVQRRIQSMLGGEMVPSTQADLSVVPSVDIAPPITTTTPSECEPTIAAKTSAANSGCGIGSPAFLAPVELDQRGDTSGPCASISGQRCSDKGFLAMALDEYLGLLDWTARQHVSGKRGSTPEDVPPIFARLAIRPEAWCELASDFGRLFGVVAGQPYRIDEHRSRRQQRPYRIRRRTRELLSGD